MKSPPFVASWLVVLVTVITLAYLIDANSPSTTTQTPSRTTTTTTTSRPFMKNSNVTNHATSAQSTPNKETTNRIHRKFPTSRLRSEATQENVAQVRRVARNVRRKMDSLSGRINQLQSMIASDHQDNSTADHSDASEQAESAAGQTSDSWSVNEPNNNGDDETELTRLTPLHLSNSTSQQLRKSPPVIKSFIAGKSDQSDANDTDQNSSDNADHDTDETPTKSSTMRPSEDEQTQDGNNNLDATTMAPTTQAQDQTQALPSLLGPVWNHGQNYHFFEEQNAKNHGNAGTVSALPIRASNRFENMTILNSQTDLANSYSMQQAYPSPPTTTSTKRPSTSAPDNHLEVQPTRAQARKSSVTTYSGNYGKTTSSPVSYQYSNKTDESLSANHHDSASTNDALQDDQGALRWPQMASPSGSASDSVGIAVFPSSSGQQYSSIMKPPSTGHSTGDTHGHSLSRTNRAKLDNHRQTDDHQYNRDQTRPSAATGLGDVVETLNAHKYSIALPSADSTSNMDAITVEEPGETGASQGDRRRSIEPGARRQYEQPMYHQVDSYSSRIDEPPTSQLNGTTTPNTGHLKHRSSGNSADDMQPGLGHNSASSDNVVSVNANSLGDPNLGSSYFSLASGAAESQTSDLSFAGPSRANQPPGPGYGAFQMSGDQFGSTSDNSFPYSTYGTSNQQAEMTSGGPQENSYADSYASSTAEAQQPIAGQQQQQQLYMSTRPASYLSAYGSGQTAGGQQDSLQPAATTTSSIDTLVRQQHLINQAQQQSAGIDLNRLLYLQRYQQQQRALAAQLQQQQQVQLMYPSSSQLLSQSPTSSSIARAFYDQQQQQQEGSLAAAIHNNMRKRYSPETALASYLTSRSSGNQLNVQPMLTQQLSTYSPQAIRAAYQRLMQQHQNQQQQQLVSLPLLYASQPSQQPQYTQVMSNGTSNTYGGGMFATAAVNQPVFYEAPSGLNSAQNQQQQQRSSLEHSASAPASSFDSSRALLSSYNSSPSISSQTSTLPLATRRNYLSGLFKPTASSRYYYAPTILSPISLSSPVGLQSLYAPAYSAPGAADGSSLAGTSPALAQYYTTAANPYAAAFAQATPAAQVSPIDQVTLQQYQHALASAAAAAAASNSYQSPYMAAAPADSDMAESSLVASDSSPVSYSTSGDSGGSSGGSSSGDSGGDGNNNNNSKGGKAMTQWASIAGLLLGVLPFGMLMAHMLPALTIAGRKKRELDFGARNLTDYLAWRAPSRVLQALMGGPSERSLALANASQIIDDMIPAAARLNGGETPNELARQRNDSSRGLQGALYPLLLKTASSLEAPSLANISRSTLARWSPLKQQQPNSSTPDHQQDYTSTKAFSFASPTLKAANSANGTTTTSPTGVKSTIKRVLGAVNNLIVTAQKRKHRSSLLDSQWNVGNPFKVNFNDFKRQLAELVRAKLLASPYSNLLGPASLQLQTLSNAPQQTGTKLESRTTPDVSDKSVSGLFARQQPNSTVISDNHRARPERVAVGTGDGGGVGVTSSSAAAGPQVAGISSISAQIHVDPGKQSGQHASNPDASSNYSQVASSNVSTRLAPPLNQLGDTKTSGQLEKHHELAGNLQESTKGPGNSTRKNLVSCLNRFFCDAIVKINQSGIFKAKSAKSPASGDQLEQTIKSYINKLMEEFETSEKYSTLETESDNVVNKSKDNFLDGLYNTALQNECSTAYVCKETQQLSRTLLRIMKTNKNKTSDRNEQS